MGGDSQIQTALQNVFHFGMNIPKLAKLPIEHTSQKIFNFFIIKTIKPWPNLRLGLYCQKSLQFFKKTFRI